MDTSGIFLIMCGFGVLLIFMVTAVHVYNIKEALEKRNGSSATQTNYAQFYEQGELNEFLGKKLEAIESYKTALFYIEKIKLPSDSDNRNKEQIKKKLVELN